MLRLHPSELSLTPDDVDETFRRIALRQTSRAQQHWTMPPAGHPGHSGRPNRPILRRGPQRLIRHATTINNIAVLQPQQAVITSVHGDDELHQEAAQPSVHANSRPSVPQPGHQRNVASVGLPAALPSQPMQLPLRLRSHLQTVDAQTMSSEQTEGSASLTPHNHVPRPARSTSSRNVENGNEQGAQLPSVDSSANTPVLRGGGLASDARAHNVTQDTIYAASPLNHVQEVGSQCGRGLSSLARASDVAQDGIHASLPLDQTQRLTSRTHQVSPGDPSKLQSTHSTDHPMPPLRKCCTETPHSNRRPCCTYKHPPSSEPRRGRGRHVSTTRSRSSGHAASFIVMCSSTSILKDPSNNISVASTNAETRSRHCRGSPNPHDEDGDASSARHLSGTLEGLGPFDQTSLRRRERSSSATGASATYSWYGSLGSQSSGSAKSQDDESCPQLDGARANTRRLSPLPSLPYTRIHNDPTASSPPCVHSRRISRDHVTASTAVRHDLPSPLDVHVEEYQRHQQTAHTLLNFATHVNPTIPSVGLPIARPSQERDMAFDDSARLGPGPSHGTRRQPSSPEHRTYSLRSLSRTSEYPRLEQRSSENDLVPAPAHGSDAARHGRVQMQRAVYERLQSAAYATHAGAAEGIELVPSHADPSRPLPSQFSRQHRAESTRQASPRVYEGGSGGRRGRPRRDGALSAVLSFDQGMETTGRPWQSPLVRGAPTRMARTHGRVRGEQRDQENTGEEELMRREEASVVARYGEQEQQQTTMNETPPRIGRVERRMLE